jgi:hypothetical protein
MNNLQKPRNALKAAELLIKVIGLMEEDEEVYKDYLWSVGTLKDIVQNIERKEFNEPSWKRTYAKKY